MYIPARQHGIRRAGDRQAEPGQNGRDRMLKCPRFASTGPQKGRGFKRPKLGGVLSFKLPGRVASSVGMLLQTHVSPCSKRIDFFYAWRYPRPLTAEPRRFGSTTRCRLFGPVLRIFKAQSHSIKIANRGHSDFMIPHPTSPGIHPISGAVPWLG